MILLIIDYYRIVTSKHPSSVDEDIRKMFDQWGIGILYSFIDICNIHYGDAK